MGRGGNRRRRKSVGRVLGEGRNRVGIFVPWIYLHHGTARIYLCVGNDHVTDTWMNSGPGSACQYFRFRVLLDGRGKRGVFGVLNWSSFISTLPSSTKYNQFLPVTSSCDVFVTSILYSLLCMAFTCS